MYIYKETYQFLGTTQILCVISLWKIQGMGTAPRLPELQEALDNVPRDAQGGLEYGIFHGIYMMNDEPVIRRVFSSFSLILA